MSMNEPDRNDNNEIAHRADTAGEDSTQQGVPSLPGRRRSRVGKLKIVLFALVAIALFASGVSMYLQRLYQQHQEDKQAALQKPKDSGDNDTTVDIAGQQILEHGIGAPRRQREVVGELAGGNRNVVRITLNRDRVLLGVDRDQCRDLIQQ